MKRIYDPPGGEDGARVLVDRLWPRGVSKDRARLRLSLKEIAPSDDLRRWFGHDPARFAEFSRRYRAELSANGEAVGRLEELVKAGRVSLLYGARDEEHNEAWVLADYLEARRQKRLMECRAWTMSFAAPESGGPPLSRSPRRRPASTRR